MNFKNFRIKGYDINTITFKNNVFSLREGVEYYYVSLQIDTYDYINIYEFWNKETLTDSILEEIDNHITRIEMFGIERIVDVMSFMRQETNYEEIIYEEAQFNATYNW